MAKRRYRRNAETIPLEERFVEAPRLSSRYKRAYAQHLYLCGSSKVDATIVIYENLSPTRPENFEWMLYSKDKYVGGGGANTFKVAAKASVATLNQPFPYGPWA